MENPATPKPVSRRNFLGGMAATAAAFTILPSGLVRGQNTKETRKLKPGDKMNIAAVGIGGMGASNLEALAGTENIVALCDVDRAYAAPVFKKYPKATPYLDYRVMLEKENANIDGVVVATPDHLHAAVAMAAMQLGKHVYVQKPLTRLVSEARALTEAARKYGVVTQMGNQGHSGEALRLVAEWIWDGAIGPVHEVHAWTNRPVWPQGIPARLAAAPIPETLDWTLWQGPSKARDFNPGYLPFVWRGWWDFGSGALGDMGCHFIDPIYHALKLRYPVAVSASIAAMINPDDVWEKLDNTETFPYASIVTYEFPARDTLPPVRLIWYDGGLMPPRPEELEPGRRMPRNGALYYGEKGKLLHDQDAGAPRLIPETAMQAYTLPPKTIPRITVSHEMNWVEACKTGGAASSNFDYAGPLAETTLMGNLAVKYPWQRLEIDGENMKVTNLDEANAFIDWKNHYREGWSL
jgi:predicted dehydrogenase